MIDSQIPIVIAGPIFVTKAQLSEAIATSPRTINDWMSRGIIPFIRIGNIVRFDLAKVKAAMEKRFEVHTNASGGTIRRKTP
jgi:excisionase family DNA binding protein